MFSLSTLHSLDVKACVLNISLNPAVFCSVTRKIEPRSRASNKANNVISKGLQF